MKMAIAIIIFFGVSLFYSPLMADVVVNVGMSGGWQSWIDPNGMIKPYWDGTSWDPGGPVNIGYYLKGNFGAGVGWQFWAHNTVGVRDKDFRFQNIGQPQIAYLLLEVAGFAQENELYWYNSSNPADKGLIFSGSDAPPQLKKPLRTPHTGASQSTHPRINGSTRSPSLEMTVALSTSPSSGIHSSQRFTGSGLKTSSTPQATRTSRTWSSSSCPFHYHQPSSFSVPA